MDEPVRYWESTARPRPDWWDEGYDRAVEVGHCATPQEIVELFSGDAALLDCTTDLWLTEAEARYRRFTPPELSDKLDWPERVLTQEEFEMILHGLGEYGRLLGITTDSVDELFDLVTEWRQEQDDPDDFVEHWTAPAEEVDFEECHPVYKKAVREIERLKRATPSAFDDAVPRDALCPTCNQLAPVDEWDSLKCPRCCVVNGTLGKLLVDLATNGPTAHPNYGGDDFKSFRAIMRERWEEFTLATVQQARDWLVANKGLTGEQCAVLPIAEAVPLLQAESPKEKSPEIHHPAGGSNVADPNARMVAKLLDDATSYWWTARKWAAFLGLKSHTHVLTLPAWGTIKAYREMNKRAAMDSAGHTGKRRKPSTVDIDKNERGQH